MRARAVLLCSIGAISLVGFGCGGDGELEPVNPADLSDAEQLVSPRDIQRFPEGSPQHGLLMWWRNVQFRNFAGYLQYFTAEARATAAKRRPGVNNFVVLSEQLRTSKPRIFRTVTRGDDATVYAVVNARRVSPMAGKRVTSTKTPQAFTMRRENGLWRLVDTVFVDLTVTPVIEAKALQQRTPTTPAP